MVLIPALACVVVIAAFFLFRSGPEPVEPANGIVQLIAEVEQFADTAVELLPAEPFSAEIMYVAEDSRQAVHSLISCAGLDPDALLVAMIN